MHRNAATKVSVFQWPCGTPQTNRWPRGLRPRVRAILVLVAVSSRKTSRAVSSFRCLRLNRRRDLATSGRSCSAACRLFFNRNPVALEKAVHRGAAAENPVFAHPRDDLVQRQIRLRLEQGKKPVRVSLQRRDAPARRRRRDASSSPPPLMPLDRRTRAYLDPIGSFPARRAGFYLFNHTHAHVHRARPHHRSTPEKPSQCT